MHNGGHIPLVVRRRAGRQRAIERSVLKLAKNFNVVDVCAPYHRGFTLVSRFMMMSLRCRRHRRAKHLFENVFKTLGTPAHIKPVHNTVADSCVMINCLKLIRSWCSVGWLTD